MSSPVATAPPALVWVGVRARQAKELLLAIHPGYVLASIGTVQSLAVLGLALTVRHNGWLYYAGGDQLWHYSGAFLLAHGHLPPALVGYGWSLLLAPIALFAGPNLVAALPPMVMLNTLVLLPVAMLCIYGIAARIAGRLFGYFAAILWVVVPYLGILFVEPGYHQKYTELTLPQALGLTSVPDFPSTVGLIVSAYFCLRAVEGASWHAAAGAGLAAGYAIAIKPSNSIFLVVPLISLLALRWRALLPFAVALAPALLTLALWKYRGLGEIAAAPGDPVRVAAGVGSVLDRVHNSDLNSFAHLRAVLAGLREHFWVARIMQWVPVAGAIALLIRSARAFLVIGIWFFAYLLAKGTYVLASLDDASFFRLLMPAFPAFVLLAASVVLLVPGVRARPPAPAAFRLPARRLTAIVVAAAAVFAVVPLGVIAATPPLHDQGRLAAQVGISLIPVSSQFDLRGKVVDGTTELSWRPRPTKTSKVFYRVFRTRDSDGIACAGRLNNAADDCRLYMDPVQATRATRFVDRPGAGLWSYRIVVSANWLDDYRYGDDYVLSRAVTLRVP